MSAESSSDDDEEHASASGTGVIAFAPVPISYTAAAGDDVYLCSQFTDTDAEPDVTYNLDDVNSVWSTDSTVACGLSALPT